MAERPLARVDGVLAAKSPIAVVFRRGPSRWVEMLRWNTETDEIVSGQWLHTKVYNKRCDISPDGRYVVLFATDYRHSSSKRRAVRDLKEGVEPTSAWTAVSRVPYFTALAIWFSGNSYGGGGIWEGPNKLAINWPLSFCEEGLSPRKSLTVRHLELWGENEPIFSRRLERHGWSTVQEIEIRKLSGPTWLQHSRECVREGIMEKPFRRGLLRRTSGLRPPYYRTDRWEIIGPDGGCVWARNETSFGPPVWLDVDHGERVIFSDQGCLWAWSGFPDGEPKLVADLNDHLPAPMEAPTWAKEW